MQKTELPFQVRFCLLQLPYWLCQFFTVLCIASILLKKNRRRINTPSSTFTIDMWRNNKVGALQGMAQALKQGYTASVGAIEYGD